MKNNFFSQIKSDLPASIVVFLVAMPLCLGIALASGAPLFSGLIAGMVGGIVTSLASKSPLGVSGPAAGLAVIVLNAITDLGDFNVFLYAVVLAGILQIILGIFKAGVIAYYFPSSVIKGMLTGIGIIIFIKQIPHAFGYDADPEGDLSFVQPDGHNTFSELFYMLDYITPGAIIISMLSLGILILWESKFMQKFPVFKMINGPLVVVTLGIILNKVFGDGGSLSLSEAQMVKIPVADSTSGFLAQFSFPDFANAWSNPDVYIVAFTIAIVASLETLLCVEATDKLDPDKRITPTNRELVAQGISNTISGLIGGLPITQVIVRSSANIQSGGKTRASAFLHGIFILIAILFIPNIINLIPLSSLAAILFVVGYKLAKPTVFKEMFKAGQTQFIPFIITVLGLVFTDLLTGIGLGLVVAIIQILWNNFNLPYHFDPEKHVKGERILIELSEDVSFLNKVSILNTLEKIPNDAVITINASKSFNIHPDILEIINDFKEKAEKKNIQLTLEGFNKSEQKNSGPTKEFQVALDNKQFEKSFEE